MSNLITTTYSWLFTQFYIYLFKSTHSSSLGIKLMQNHKAMFNKFQNFVMQIIHDIINKKNKKKITNHIRKVKTMFLITHGLKENSY